MFENPCDAGPYGVSRARGDGVSRPIALLVLVDMYAWRVSIDEGCQRLRSRGHRQPDENRPRSNLMEPQVSHAEQERWEALIPPAIVGPEPRVALVNPLELGHNTP